MFQQGSKELRETTVLAVPGMTCGGCANTVARILSHVPGAVGAKVDIETGRAMVEGEASAAALIAALASAGYGAEVVAAQDGAGGSNGGD